MADIYINYGTNLAEMTYFLMEEASISDNINNNMHIVINPNLVVSAPAGTGATTHPEIVEGIIIYLKEHGVENITIAEGAWVGDDTKLAFKICGYESLRDKYDIKLYDTKDDELLEKTYNNHKYKICKIIEEADYLINVPVLKGHCQTKMTCAMKNLKGCISDAEKRRYHTIGLHEPIAELNAVLKPDLNIIDSVCGDLTHEEGGNPVDTDRVMLSFDSLLTDSYAASLMGYDVEEVGYLKIARDLNLGQIAGSGTVIKEYNTDKKPKHKYLRSDVAENLSRYIEEDGACSACYASLIFALDKIDKNKLDKLFHEKKIKIGQGYKKKNVDGFGIGNCLRHSSECVQGCPPKASKIIEYINKKSEA